MIVSNQHAAFLCVRFDLFIGPSDIVANRLNWPTVRLMKRYADNDSGPTADLRSNRESSTRQFRPLAHAVQAKAALHCGCIKAGSGIYEAELERLSYHAQLHLRIKGLCMLGDVPQGFLSDSIETSPNTAGNIIRQLLRMKLNRDSFAL